jgi:hypothetical protein
MPGARSVVAFADSGLWRSLVARLTGGQEVGSSSLPSPTSETPELVGGFVLSRGSHRVQRRHRGPPVPGLGRVQRGAGRVSHPHSFLVAGVGAGCGSPQPVVQAPSNQIARDLHLATGHVDPECYVFGNLDVTIVVTDSGFKPACVVADGDVGLIVSNDTAEDATFWAVDSAEGAQSAIHLRIALEVGAGEEARLERVGDLVARGSYPFFLIERLETQGGVLRIRRD